jgi:MFS-type transporter involved in bile tolerance (Atg22 family)
VPATATSFDPSADQTTKADRSGSGFRLPVSPGIALFGVLAAFTLANYAYQGAQPFYNAMMPELVPVDHRGRLSGMGAALGYVGSITGVLLTFPFFTGQMPILGAIPGRVIGFLRSAVPFTTHGGRVSTFVPTALLFFLFSLPLFFFCRDHNVIHGKKRIAWREAFLDHERAKGELKALMPEDAKEAIGHGIRAKRSKAGAVSFDLLDTEAAHAALQ